MLEIQANSKYKPTFFKRAAGIVQGAILDDIKVFAYTLSLCDFAGKFAGQAIRTANNIMMALYLPGAYSPLRCRYSHLDTYLQRSRRLPEMLTTLGQRDAFTLGSKLEASGA